MQIPLFKPQTEWLPPENFPDLETHDPNLKTLGSGAIINVGKVVGIAVAFKDKKLYYPIGHVGARPPYTAKKVWKKLNDNIFQNKKITTSFHNAMYDVCWIRSATGDMPQGALLDTMIAASVIDETRMKYSLDSISKDYLKESKYKYDFHRIIFA